MAHRDSGPKGLFFLFLTGEKKAFKIFLSAIFYVGKGKKSRAFAHFKEAMQEDRQVSFVYLETP